MGPEIPRSPVVSCMHIFTYRKVHWMASFVCHVVQHQTASPQLMPTFSQLWTCNHECLWSKTETHYPQQLWKKLWMWEEQTTGGKCAIMESLTSDWRRKGKEGEEKGADTVRGIMNNRVLEGSFYSVCQLSKKKKSLLLKCSSEIFYYSGSH